MLTNDTLSLDSLHAALRNSPSGHGVKKPEGNMLRFSMHDRECMIAVIGPHQIRLMMPSIVSVDSGLSRLQQLEIVNEINSDLMLSAGAYLSEDDDIVFTRALSVSGGISENNFVMAVHEFFVECALNDDLIKKHTS